MPVYATVGDFAQYAGLDAVHTDTERQLARASELVDSLLITAVYHPDAPHVRDALRQATCAIVQWWGETGDETGASSQYAAMQIGTLRLQRSEPAPEIPPAAVRILATAGLLQHPPWTR